MRTITCPCGKSKQADNNNVGDTTKQTGFSPTFCADATVAWFCPACFGQIAVHVKAITKLSGDNENLNFKSLCIAAERYEKAQT